MNLRRLFMSRKHRATVDYLEQLVEADRTYVAERNLRMHVPPPCPDRIIVLDEPVEVLR